MTDVVKSMVLDGQQGGLLPKWSQENAEDFVMNRRPRTIIVASAYAFGVRSFDTATALSLNGQVEQRRHRPGQPDPRAGERVPVAALHRRGSSDSLEYSASDFAVAQLRDGAGGHHEIQHLHHPGAVVGQHLHTDASYVSRHNSDRYLGLAAGSGEPDRVHRGERRAVHLDGHLQPGRAGQPHGRRADRDPAARHHFTQVNGGLTTQYFYIATNPSTPCRGPTTSRHTRRVPPTPCTRLMSDGFNTAPGGLPGNDDLGATSAWYVWAAMGMYPATPGADTLALHGPSFPSILIQRAAGNVTIGAAGSGPYVQSLSVNGSGTTHNYGPVPGPRERRHAVLYDGRLPGSWGTGAGDVPQSFTTGFTPPAAAPALGTNLALGKATTSSATCAATEPSGKAVDGTLAGNSSGARQRRAPC